MVCLGGGGGAKCLATAAASIESCTSPEKADEWGGGGHSNTFFSDFNFFLQKAPPPPPVAPHLNLIIATLLVNNVHYDDCFHTRAKVCNLNAHSNCAIWMIIRMIVFWTVCVCKITSRGVIWIAQFKLRIAAINDHWNCTILLSCENSLWHFFIRNHLGSVQLNTLLCILGCEIIGLGVTP